VQRAEVSVKERDGAVELHVAEEGQEETVVILDGHTARTLGDDLFRAGCNTGL
jgi:hypothetical protein